MYPDLYPRIQKRLEQKRHTITEFLETAPDAEKEICLCGDETEVQTHLDVIEASLEKIEDQTLGLCTVCHGYIESGRLEMDYTASVCLDHYSPEEMRRLEAELELSQVVQRALLPQRIPEIRGVDLAAFSRPSEIIGGDYFDFFQFRDGMPGLVIADVSGHGVSAGMLMSSLQTALRTIAPETDSPAEIVERINRFYIHNINFTTFVTVFLARFDPASRSLEYVNAGHNPPAWLSRHYNETRWLKPTIAAVGLLEDFHPQAHSMTLSAGDVLLFYTDGVTEAQNPLNEQFGQHRLSGLIQNNKDLSASDLIQVVRQGLNAFGENKRLEDDATLIALKYSG
ncbi:MAG: SpoIIE family protein phosphatase [Chloroflexota bacterium]